MFFVHGAGRTGKDAWPDQPAEGTVYADHGQATTMAAKAAAVGKQAPRGPFAVVAHSLGAVAAAVAIRDHGLSPTHVILAEPALYDLARGHEAVEAHIEPMTRARANAAAGDLFGYWQIVKPLMFGTPASRGAWAEDIEQARKFAAIEAPWGHGLRADIFTLCPTLVITGGWNPEYDAIAARLADGGCTNVVLQGSGHRVQDHPEFNGVLANFMA